MPRLLSDWAVPGVLRAQHLLVDGQGLLEIGPRPRVVPLVMQQAAQVVERLGGAGGAARPAPSGGWPGPARNRSAPPRSPPGNAASGPGFRAVGRIWGAARPAPSCGWPGPARNKAAPPRSPPGPAARR